MITTKKYSLKGLRTKPPHISTSGGYWVGVSHHQLLTHLNDAVRDHGWVIGDHRTYTYKKGRGMIAAHDIITSPLPPVMSFRGYVPSLAILNDNSGEASVRMYGGFRSLKTNAGLVCYEWVVGKHTIHVPFKDRIHDIVGHFKKILPFLIEEMHRWENRYLDSRNHVNVALFFAGRQKLIPWSRLSGVDVTYDASPQTALGLFHAFATQAGRSPVTKQLRNIHEFYLIIKKTLSEKRGTS